MAGRRVHDGGKGFPQEESAQTLVVLGTRSPPLEIFSYSKASAETEAILFNLEIRFNTETP